MAKNTERNDKRPTRFDASLQLAGGQTILRLPDAASKELPSRGQVAVHSEIDGHPFEAVVEPDGKFGHWMRIASTLQKFVDAVRGDKATVSVKPTEEWPEPNVPQDLREALSDASRDVQDLWRVITPMARWEWVRWINATRNPDTRARRVEVSISKLNSEKLDLAASTLTPVPTRSLHGAASSSWTENRSRRTLAYRLSAHRHQCTCRLAYCPT